MSRIGKQPISVPSGVEVKLDSDQARVKGPKGELQVRLNELVSVAQTEGELTVSVQDPEDRKQRALWGLARALLSNAVVGVSSGFEKGLIVVGVGYRAEIKGKSLDMSLGFSHPVVVDAPAGIEFSVEGAPAGIESAQALVKISGADKELVGRTAANIRKIRPPEPYKGKGIRYTDEHVRRKAGKTAA
ncbi:MAG: 50S ribosomal protein L6 [Candidatus Latescibacteria bacterium]|nr:50S ribosomal protein L6 [Candidatus Latescibacterota bacterium]